MRPLRGLQEPRVATREESGVQGFPSRPWSCEGKLGVLLESLQGQRELIEACVQDLIFLSREDRDHADPLRPALSLGGQATAWEGSPGRSLCLTKSSACGRLWQFLDTRLDELSLAL